MLSSGGGGGKLGGPARRLLVGSRRERQYTHCSSGEGECTAV